mmetsp:Transcript_6579/g.14843  ORF Transcript_6579/g.14843 Transcript_6579/m.14843 type:complete len:228 (-) Transcript_6579:256-939(-)
MSQVEQGSVDEAHLLVLQSPRVVPQPFTFFATGQVHKSYCTHARAASAGIGRSCNGHAALLSSCLRWGRWSWCLIRLFANLLILEVEECMASRRARIHGRSCNSTHLVPEMQQLHDFFGRAYHGHGQTFNASTMLWVAMHSLGFLHLGIWLQQISDLLIVDLKELAAAAPGIWTWRILMLLKEFDEETRQQPCSSSTTRACSITQHGVGLSGASVPIGEDTYVVAFQ